MAVLISILFSLPIGFVMGFFYHLNIENARGFMVSGGWLKKYFQHPQYIDDGGLSF